jgi:hypothetical protein
VAFNSTATRFELAVTVPPTSPLNTHKISLPLPRRTTQAAAANPHALVAVQTADGSVLHVQGSAVEPGGFATIEVGGGTHRFVSDDALLASPGSGPPVLSGEVSTQ